MRQVGFIVYRAKIRTALTEKIIKRLFQHRHHLCPETSSIFQEKLKLNKPLTGKINLSPFCVNSTIHESRIFSHKRQIP